MATAPMISISGELTAALSALGRGLGVTLNTMVQAAWAILLGRLTGRDDVVFGITVAGRPPEIAGIETMVVLFINTLPLRVRLPASQPLSALLAELQDSQSRLMAHQHVGLAELQGLVGLGELFDTLVVFENYPADRDGGATVADGLRLAGMSGHDATHYPLTLMAVPGERLELRFDYRGERIDRVTVEGIGVRLVRLLEAAVASPAASIGRLEILSGAERELLLGDWNATAQTVGPSTVPQLFGGRAGAAPDATAVVCGEEQLSYGALEAASNRLAHHHRSLGVGPEVVVGVCLERSVELIVTLLGILKAGGAYLPLDPDYPSERLVSMVRDAGAGVVVSRTALREKLAATAAAMLWLDDAATQAAIATRLATAPKVALSPANTAYVIYTSGSSGQPKGVAVSHLSLANKVQTLGDQFNVDPVLREAFISSIGFDPSIEQATMPQG